MTVDIDKQTALVKEKSAKFHLAKDEISKVIVGQEVMIERLLLALLADGHILLEGLPGLAKTLAVNTLAKVIDSNFTRIQFTPDLLPADLIGTSIYNPKDGTFSIKKGPIFTNILLADEINRAPAKVQSALLEVMQEKQVTIQGETFKLEAPYLVLATQNPIEQEGTYPLPEAQTDRFMMKIQVNYPSKDEEREIVKRMTVFNALEPVKSCLTPQDILEARQTISAIYVDPKVTEYILNIVFATRFPKEFNVPIEDLLTLGASPRASIALTKCAKAYAFLAGRGYVTPNDVKQIGFDVLRHRLRRSYEAEAEGVSPDAIIDAIFNTLDVP